MTNVGKERYDAIIIPDDKLIRSIENGIKKYKNSRWKFIAEKCTVAIASILLILFTTANIPIIYAYMENIPFFNNFVRAFRVGNGGKEINNVTCIVKSDNNQVDIFFKKDNLVTNDALLFSTSHHWIPSTLEIFFYGENNIDFENIREELLKISVIKDVYKIFSLENNAFGFSIVLEKGYNYEVMEFNNPGVLNIRFFPDAYFEKGEFSPNQVVHYIRSSPTSNEKELKELLLKYSDEKPYQVKTMHGKYIIVIGNYNTEYEAKSIFELLTKKYGTNLELYCDSTKAGDIPVE